MQVHDAKDVGKKQGKQMFAACLAEAELIPMPTHQSNRILLKC